MWACGLASSNQPLLRAGGGLVRTEVESSETESAGHYSEENLRMSVNCGREGGEGYIRRARDPASRPASAWFFQLARQTLVEGFYGLGGFVSLVDIGFLFPWWIFGVRGADFASEVRRWRRQYNWPVAGAQLWRSDATLRLWALFFFPVEPHGEVPPPTNDDDHDSHNSRTEPPQSW